MTDARADTRQGASDSLSQQQDAAAEEEAGAVAAAETGVRRKSTKKKHTGENALRRFFPDNFCALHRTQGVLYAFPNDSEARSAGLESAELVKLKRSVVQWASVPPVVMQGLGGLPEDCTEVGCCAADAVLNRVDPHRAFVVIRTSTSGKGQWSIVALYDPPSTVVAERAQLNSEIVSVYRAEQAAKNDSKRVRRRKNSAKHKYMSCKEDQTTAELEKLRQKRLEMKQKRDLETMRRMQQIKVPRHETPAAEDRDAKVPGAVLPTVLLSPAPLIVRIKSESIAEDDAQGFSAPACAHADSSSNSSGCSQGTLAVEHLGIVDLPVPRVTVSAAPMLTEDCDGSYPDMQQQGQGQLTPGSLSLHLGSGDSPGPLFFPPASSGASSKPSSPTIGCSWTSTFCCSGLYGGAHSPGQMLFAQPVSDSEMPAGGLSLSAAGSPLHLRSWSPPHAWSPASSTFQAQPSPQQQMTMLAPPTISVSSPIQPLQLPTPRTVVPTATTTITSEGTPKARPVPTLSTAALSAAASEAARSEGTLLNTDPTRRRTYQDISTAASLCTPTSSSTLSAPASPTRPLSPRLCLHERYRAMAENCWAKRFGLADTCSWNAFKDFVAERNPGSLDLLRGFFCDRDNSAVQRMRWVLFVLLYHTEAWEDDPRPCLAISEAAENMQQDAFHGALDRATAETILRNLVDRQACYLFRATERSPGFMVLSRKHKYVRGDQCWHTLYGHHRPGETVVVSTCGRNNMPQDIQLSSQHDIKSDFFYDSLNPQSARYTSLNKIAEEKRKQECTDYTPVPRGSGYHSDSDSFSPDFG